jgi:hypothetical protein
MGVKHFMICWIRALSPMSATLDNLTKRKYHNQGIKHGVIVNVKYMNLSLNGVINFERNEDAP